MIAILLCSNINTAIDTYREDDDEMFNSLYKAN